MAIGAARLTAAEPGGGGIAAPLLDFFPFDPKRTEPAESSNSAYTIGGLGLLTFYNFCSKVFMSPVALSFCLMTPTIAV